MDLVDFEGNRQFAKFTSFKMAGEAEKYKLVLGAFVEGSAGTCPRWAVAWPSEGFGKQREPPQCPGSVSPGRHWVVT